MKKKLLFAAAMLLAAVGVNAQTDVTSTYLTNADFSSTDGWSAVVSTQYKDFGNGLIGTYGVRTNEGQAVSTVDETHLASEYCFGFECRWSSSYASFTQVTKTPLIPGAYTLTFDVENTNPKTNSASYENRFTVKVGETTYTDSSTEWMRGKSSWTTHTISFTVEEESSATISLGYGTGSNNIGSTNTPTLHISHLKLTYQSLLDGLKAMWQEAHDAAQAAYENTDYSNVSGAENDALYAEIDKAEPTTKEGYEEAIAALNNATAAFTAAKTSYDAYVDAINDAFSYTIEDWPYASAAKATALNDAIDASDPTNAEDAATKAAAIVTAYRQFVESNGLAEGVEGAVDMTSSLTYSDAAVKAGWSGIGTNTNEGYTDGEGRVSTKYFDGGWSSSAGANISVTQEVTLPAGEYLLQITARGANALETYTMSVGENSVVLPQESSTGGTFGRGWSDKYITFESDGATPTTITITANSTAYYQWVSFNRLRLMQLEAHIDRAALLAAINNATAAKNRLNVGEDVFQIPTSALTALEAAIDAAQAVYDNEAATLADVEAAITTINDAVSAFEAAPLNAPEAGNQYGITIVTEGHPFIGNAIVAGNGEITGNNPTGNFFNVKGDSPYLAQTFTFTSAENAEDPNLYYISVELPEGTVYLTNGTNNGSAASWAPSQIQGTIDSSKRLAFRIAASTTVEGAFNIINTANDYKVIAQNGGNIYTDENAQGNGEFALVEPTLVEVPVAVTAGKFATRIYPFKPAVANDGIVYYSCEAAEENELTLSEVAEPAANVPYILEAKLDVNETQQGYSIAGANSYTDGWLTGVFASTTITEGYVLQTLNEKQAFYKVSADAAITVPAFRAYLNKSDSDVKSFNLGDDTTGISALEALTNNAFEAIYSADGVKLNRIEKGVNILKMSDGTTRKVILK